MLKLKELYQYKRELKKSNTNLGNIFKKPSIEIKFILNTGGILYIKALKKNTFVTLTDLKGKIEAKHSCGSMGFQGKKKRSTRFAFETTLHAILNKAAEKGKSYLFVCVSGYGYLKLKSSFLKSFEKHSIKIIGVRDITPHPHNGCRPKKIRRI